MGTETLKNFHLYLKIKRVNKLTLSSLDTQVLFKQLILDYFFVGFRSLQFHSKNLRTISLLVRMFSLLNLTEVVNCCTNSSYSKEQLFCYVHLN